MKLSTNPSAVAVHQTSHYKPILWPGIIGGALGYQILLWMGGDALKETIGDANPYQTKSKLEVLLGPQIWSEVKGKVIIDLGCGGGSEVIEMAQHGAFRAIGIDIREKVLDIGRLAAEKAGVADKCVFTMQTDEKADRILSIDGFEHYDDPEEILRAMRHLIKKDGRILVSFGPIWYHPYGSHLYGLFPWAHMIFTEKALMRWRSDFKSDGARLFREVEGGLNQMTIHRFRSLVERSDFKIEKFEAVPIRKARLFHNNLTQEFLTSTVRCTLAPR
jgi:SAM-dependent methyltransferase